MAHKPRFDLGRVVATPAALDAIGKAMGPLAHDTVLVMLSRHHSGDWGDLCPEDVQSNNEALELGNRLLSSYRIPGSEQNVWIITEWDRSVTTVLLPEDY
jgi:hypothetical protein